MKEFIRTLEQEFERNANTDIAKGQMAYMRNQFAFYGLKAPVRREISKPFFAKKEYLPPKKKLETIIRTLWLKPQRDYQQFAQDLAFKYIKQFERKDIALLEFMVVHKSWWDTVDFIAAKLMGEYFKLFPEERKKYVDKWLASKNIWLQRSALLFQLKYKKNTNTQLLSYAIHALLGSNEFFINKAIGWVLREYSKTNPEWVIDFVSNTPLSPLSKREALRLIK